MEIKKKRFKKKVEEYKLQDHFVFEGNQENPYPYIKCADVYVQPSYYEAYSTTVTEAKVLHKPIVVTDVGGMREQLFDIESEKIVSISIEQIENAILFLLNNREKTKRFKNEIIMKKCMEKYLGDYYSSIFI